MSVRGIERVRANVTKILANASDKVTGRAVYAILSQGGALADTMTPIDTSTLVNSRYRPEIKTVDGKTTGTVGYTANYAAAVHSAPGTLKGVPRPGNRGNHWDPDGEPGFLTKGFEKLQPSIPKILEEIYRV